jgi:hypothetical protein
VGCPLLAFLPSFSNSSPGPTQAFLSLQSPALISFLITGFILFHRIVWCTGDYQKAVSSIALSSKLVQVQTCWVIQKNALLKPGLLEKSSQTHQDIHQELV